MLSHEALRIHQHVLARQELCKTHKKHEAVGSGPPVWRVGNPPVKPAEARWEIGGGRKGKGNSRGKK